MKRTISILASLALLIILGSWLSTKASEDNSVKDKAQRTAQQEARQQKRAERLAAYEKFVDSLVMSHSFRFVPQTMQQLPAGPMRTLQNPCYEVMVGRNDVDVCIPFLKGYTPPYYPVVFNYVLPTVDDYIAEQTDNGWHISFKSPLFSATDYTFSFEINSHYGGATLIISTPMYNSIQYSGNIVAI